MSEKINKKNHTDRTIFIFTGLVVIVVNVFLIILGFLNVSESEKRILMGEKNNFERNVEYDVGLLEKWDEWLSSYIQSNLDYMSNTYNFSSVKSIMIVNDIAKVINMYEIPGIVFLKESESGISYISTYAGMYSVREQQQLKAAILEINEKNIKTTNKWQLEKIHNRYYFTRYIVFQNYYLMLGMDVDAQLRKWITSLSDNDIVFFECENEMLAIDFASHEVKSIELAQYRCIDSYVPDTSSIRITISLLRTKENSRNINLNYVLFVFSWVSAILLCGVWIGIHRKMERKDLLLYQTQLNNLKLQVNPHMLLNSFTMIYSMAETRKYEVIQKFALHLTSYFRYCLRTDESLVTVCKEMKFVEDYIEIQKIRFPGEISSVYMVAEDAENAMIPQLLIQNFVENSAKYARIPEKTIEILIHVRKDENRLLLSISDTGKGITEEVLTALNRKDVYLDENGEKHIGIWNCRRRMKAFYGNDYEIKIVSKPDAGTQVWIDLPFIQGEVG